MCPDMMTDALFKQAADDCSKVATDSGAGDHVATPLKTETETSSSNLDIGMSNRSYARRQSEFAEPQRAVASLDVYENLDCALCARPFDADARAPKVLGCHHTVCRSCAVAAFQQDENCACPYCDACTVLRSFDDVDALLDNCLVGEILSQQNRVPTRRGSRHQAGGNEAASAASQVVPKGANFASSNETPAPAAATVRAPLSVPTQCVLHEEEFKYVCNQCQIPVCVSCTVMIDGGHHGHGMISLDKGRRAVGKALPALLVAGARRIEELQNCLDSSSLVAVQLQGSYESTRAAIDRHFDALAKQIEAKRRDLRESLERTIGARTADAQQRCVTLRRRQLFLSAAIAHAEQELQRERTSSSSSSSSSSAPSNAAYNTASSSSLMSASNSLTSLASGMSSASSMLPSVSRAAALTERVVLMAHAQRELSGSLERSAELVFAASPDAVSVVFQVDDERYQLPTSAVGSLRVTTVSLAHTRFENDLSTAHPGEEIELVWQLCDADGTDALQSGWLWTAVLQSQREAGDVGDSVNDLLIPNQNITDFGEGRYSVRFIAEPGAWTLRVSSSSGEELPLQTVFTSENPPARLPHVPSAAIRLIGREGQGPSEFQHPVGVAIDANRRVLFVADCWNHRVQALQLDSFDGGDGNEFLDVAWEYGTAGRSGSAPGSLYRPRGCSLSADGETLFVIDQQNHRVVALDARSGSLQGAFGSKGSKPGQFSSPWGIAASASAAAKTVWVADANNHRVQCVSAVDGRFLREIGMTGSSGSSNAHFNYPVDVAVRGPHLFVADLNNHRVQMFDEASGEWMATVGDGVGGALEGQLNQPQGLAIDARRGLIYIAELGNKRISIFHASSGEYRGCIGADGVDVGEFQFPTGLCVDSQRARVFCADFNLHRVSDMPAVVD